MHLTARDLLLALLIGAEVFAIAALWPLSEWAASARRAGGFAMALLVIAACVGVGLAGSWRWSIGQALGGLPLLALFMALPAAVGVASAQSLTRAGMGARTARRAALIVSLLAVPVAPMAMVLSGCDLAGACF